MYQRREFNRCVLVVNVLSRALKEAARAGNGHGLIHDPFTKTEVLVEPLVGLLVLAGDLVRLEAVDAVSLATGPGHLSLLFPVRWGGGLGVGGFRGSLTSSRSIASCPREMQRLWFGPTG